MKEILLEWVNKHLSASITINQNNYQSFLGDTDMVLKSVVEFALRNELLEKYLEQPSDETIVDYFKEKVSYYKEYGYSGVEQRVFNNIVRLFNCTDNLLY